MVVAIPALVFMDQTKYYHCITIGYSNSVVANSQCQIRMQYPPGLFVIPPLKSVDLCDGHLHTMLNKPTLAWVTALDLIDPMD